MFQKATIIGNLGADPEMRTTGGGLAVCNLRVAVAGRKKTDETTWWRVVCFRQAAEFASTYLKKGGLVLCEGEIKQSKWTDKNGQERTTLELVADTVKGLSKKEAPAQSQHNGAAGHSDQGGRDEIPF